MAKTPKLRLARNQPGGINPASHGRRSYVTPITLVDEAWIGRMQAAQGGAKEVMVKITGGGRDADGVQAHFEYLDRHGKLEMEDNHGEKHQGKAAGTVLVNDWGLGYGNLPGSPHSRDKVSKASEVRRTPRQAFNIILSMPPGTPPEAVLNAAKKFARETFANQHRYVMTLHTHDRDWNRLHNPGFINKNDHGRHPHVHLVVKAEHEYGGPRLNPRKADLRQWREDFATYLNEQGVWATATRRVDRGLAKTHKRAPIHRAAQRHQQGARVNSAGASLYTDAGDSKFMRRKLEAVKRELKTYGSVQDREAYQALLNVRADVRRRLQTAIELLRRQGREDEARRFELTLANLPAVRTEKQLLADALMVQRDTEPPLLWTR